MITPFGEQHAVLATRGAPDHPNPHSIRRHTNNVAGTEVVKWLRYSDDVEIIQVRAVLGSQIQAKPRGDVLVRASKKCAIGSARRVGCGVDQYPQPAL
jgi:hypothetical protein